MLRRLTGAALVIFFAWSSTAQALGLGDIRLQSALNEPFRAEIDLLSVTPEELRGLTVQLASSDTFRRYGLDRPPFLTEFSFDVSARPGDRGVVTVTSVQPITEPFVTFLAEATWPRGRLLREYTVLLDPPTFAGGQAAQTAPVQAPVATSAPARSDAGSIRRDDEPRRPVASPSLAGGDTYRVQRSDTLWEIAERVRPDRDLSMNQVMVSLYDANPEAFDGNINLLREGALLRIPSSDAMYGINRAQALAEVRQQNSAWRSAGSEGSLRLVPPEEAPAEAAGPSTGPGETVVSGAVEERVRRLEAELAERDRLLAIKDRELAQLREQLRAASAVSEAAEAVEVEPVAEEEPAVADTDLEPEPEAVTAEDEIFSETEPVEPAVEAEPEVEEPAVTTPPARTTPAVVTRPAEPEGTWKDTIMGLLGNIWTYVGLGVVAIAFVLAFLARRRRSDTEATGTWEALGDRFDEDEEHEATARLRALAKEDESILVVEQEDRPETRAAAAATTGAAAAALADVEEAESAEPSPESYSLEDTFSSETAINLDQSDPLAEADFHMAYGLYDQAADLVRNAIAADPDRNDLKAKLAEVYFVWGNKDAFVDAAENLHDAMDGQTDADWDKILIMGQQIAPDHKLFAGAAKSGGAVDLSFDEDSGIGTLDVDFGADEESGLDLDFGGEAEAGEAELLETTGGLDFELEADRSGTNEMLIEPEEITDLGIPTGEEDITQESPTIERPMDDTTQESPTLESQMDEITQEITQETPTIESPAAGTTQETPTVESSALGEEDTSELPAFRPDVEDLRAEQTAEIDLDDLGLDLDDLDDLEESGQRSATVLQLRADEDAGEEEEAEDELLDGSGETQVLMDDDATMAASEADEFSGDEETLLASGSDEQVRIGDEDATLMAPGDTDYSDWAETEALSEEDRVDLSAVTGQMPALEGSDVDIDLDDLTAALKRSDLGDLETPREEDTVEQPAGDAADLTASDVFDDDELDSILDLDLGEDLDEDQFERTDSVLQEEASSEGRTQTEVGTKLDLARAYIDMGDPEGARSILQEVLDEGDQGQRQEANRLLEALPE